MLNVCQIDVCFEKSLMDKFLMRWKIFLRHLSFKGQQGGWMLLHIKTVSRWCFMAEKQIFSKKALVCLDFKEAKLSHSWMVLTAVSWEHSGIFCYYFLIFWQNIPLCSQLSAVRTIQLWLNLASLDKVTFCPFRLFVIIFFRFFPKVVLSQFHFTVVSIQPVVLWP